MSKTIPAQLLERCLHYAGLPGVNLCGEDTVMLNVPGIGYIHFEYVLEGERAVYHNGDWLGSFRSKTPGWSIRATTRHRSVWRFAQLIARELQRLHAELSKALCSQAPNTLILPFPAWCEKDHWRGFLDDARYGDNMTDVFDDLRCPVCDRRVRVYDERFKLQKSYPTLPLPT